MSGSVPLACDDPRRRLPGNYASSLLLTVGHLGAMLWMTPFLLQRVGLEPYGLPQLAIQVSAYAGIVFVALNGSERRFVTMLVQNGRAGEAAGALRTTVTLNVALAALLKVEPKGSPGFQGAARCSHAVAWDSTRPLPRTWLRGSPKLVHKKQRWFLPVTTPHTKPQRHEAHKGDPGVTLALPDLSSAYRCASEPAGFVKTTNNLLCTPEQNPGYVIQNFFGRSRITW
jgi:hypothetical protein